VVLGPKLLKDMEDQMVKIKKNLKASRDRQKVYADKNRKTREFKVGEHVLLKVKPKKTSLKLRICTNLEARFRGPFEILDRIGPVAYMLALHASMNVHNIFHVSLLMVQTPTLGSRSTQDRSKFSLSRSDFFGSLLKPLKNPTHRSW
jgi:hypothetical protein